MKVRDYVITKFDSFDILLARRPSIGWNPDMDKLLGRLGIITRIDGVFRKTYYVMFSTGQVFCYPKECLIRLGR